ncbi:ExbD/TolR family protein [Immundisolibacter sp.]|uniref:ExbD/TolR family protein n=1 Tax=Immundisolibacter sp. TaxID=1934948 RepID=UPI000EE38AE7|nr:biopolymer transporter ExbD [Gammaproteobacteria bacterium]
MAFGSLGAGGRQTPQAEINMIPLIDVMLVLLVIFIVTAPLLTHAVRVELPQAQSAPVPTDAEVVELSLDAQGQAYWNGQPLTDEALPARFADAATRQPQPELRLHADGAVPYREVARVMGAAAAAGLSRVGFVTDPRVTTD